MLLLGIIFLVRTIPLASPHILSTISSRFTFLILIYSILLFPPINGPDGNIFLLGELFQLFLLSQKLLIFIGNLSLIEESAFIRFPEINNFLESEILLSVFVPIMIYSNAETDKIKILSENKGLSGVYMFTHNQSGKIYIDSAVDLSKRLNNYFKKAYLERNKTMYIYNALLVHGYSAFTLTILENLDISNLSKENAKNLILEREQYYLDVIFSENEPNTYNILKIAGSSLGYKHTDKSLAKKTGKNHHMFGKTGESHPFFGRSHSLETISKISVSKGGGTIYVYDNNGSLINIFYSTREAGKYFNCSHVLIYKYLKNGKLFKKQCILSTHKN